MTGIERLRALSAGWEEMGLGGVLADVADQIERELSDERRRRSRDWREVSQVQREMRQNLFGHDSAGDDLLSRWAERLLAAICSSVADDVSTSAYDALPEDEREAIAWVREHGGLDAMVELSSRLMTVDALRAAIEETCTRIGVERTGDLTQDAQAIWREIGALRSRLKESVPRAAYERHLARRQRQIDESHAALRRRNARIGFLVSELNRANHENHEEFMRRAGDYTAFTDEVCKLLASELRYVEGCSKDVMDAALGALDRRLMPEGMEWPRFEDGEPVRPVDRLLDGNGDWFKAVSFMFTCDWWSIRGYQTEGFGDLNDKTRRSLEGMAYGTRVKRPAPEDSWERLEEDAKLGRCDYNKAHGYPACCIGCDGLPLSNSCSEIMARDLVRRAKALAERDS